MWGLRMDVSVENKPNNRIRILSLNGGGARGLFTISVLSEIERIVSEKQVIRMKKLENTLTLLREHLLEVF